VLYIVGIQTVLSNEWDTIDNAVHRLDISTKIEAEINNHIYLKFTAQQFKCLDSGTISLPVSATINFCRYI